MAIKDNLKGGGSVGACHVRITDNVAGNIQKVAFTSLDDNGNPVFGYKDFNSNEANFECISNSIILVMYNQSCGETAFTNAESIWGNGTRNTYAITAAPGETATIST